MIVADAGVPGVRRGRPRVPPLLLLPGPPGRRPDLHPAHAPPSRRVQELKTGRTAGGGGDQRRRLAVGHEPAAAGRSCGGRPGPALSQTTSQSLAGEGGEKGSE